MAPDAAVHAELCGVAASSHAWLFTRKLMKVNKLSNSSSDTMATFRRSAATRAGLCADSRRFHWRDAWLASAAGSALPGADGEEGGVSFRTAEPRICTFVPYYTLASPQGKLWGGGRPPGTSDRIPPCQIMT